MLVNALPPFEHIINENEEEKGVPLWRHTYQTVFEDFNHGEATIINPPSVLRVRLERKEAAWGKLPSEFKA